MVKKKKSAEKLNISYKNNRALHKIVQTPGKFKDNHGAANTAAVTRHPGWLRDTKIRSKTKKEFTENLNNSHVSINK